MYPQSVGADCIRPLNTVTISILQRRGYANDCDCQSTALADAIRPYEIYLFFVKNHLRVESGAYPRSPKSQSLNPKP
jgi:hypothetical protein